MSIPKIDEYQFGRIVIDGQVYTHDLILYPNRVDRNWWREQGHSLALVDLWEVLQSPPEILVVGQGSYGRMVVPLEVRQELQKRGIELITEATGDACESYNQLCETRRVIAALHLTC